MGILARGVTRRICSYTKQAKFNEYFLKHYISAQISMVQYGTVELRTFAPACSKAKLGNLLQYVWAGPCLSLL